MKAIFHITTTENLKIYKLHNQASVVYKQCKENVLLYQNIRYLTYSNMIKYFLKYI